MSYTRANLIAFVHFAIATLALMIYSWIDTSIEQSVPRYVVPATLTIFGVTIWAACRCAYSYGLRDSTAKTDVPTETGVQPDKAQRP